MLSRRLIVILIICVCLYNLFPSLQTLILSFAVLCAIIFLFTIILRQDKDNSEFDSVEVKKGDNTSITSAQTVDESHRNEVTAIMERKLSFPQQLPVRGSFFIETLDYKRVFYEDGHPVEVCSLNYITSNEDIRRKEKLRATQCDSFKIEDMYQFSDIPFKWNFVVELSHTKGIAWFVLNMNNQEVAMSYISEVNQLIIDAHEEIPNIDDFYIAMHTIDYFLPYPMRKDSIPHTCVMCYPYTPTGRLSKYPVILQFSSTQMFNFANAEPFQAIFCRGYIKILQSGKIGMAYVLFAKNHTNFKLGLENNELIIKRIDSSNGNIYKHPSL